MNDERIEAWLRRHRPAGPPASLRDRCLEAATRHDRATSPRSRWVAWAAAALVALALGTYRASATLQPEFVAEAPEVAAISALAASLVGVPSTSHSPPTSSGAGLSRGWTTAVPTYPTESTDEHT